MSRRRYPMTREEYIRKMELHNTISIALGIAAAIVTVLNVIVMLH